MGGHKKHKKKHKKKSRRKSSSSESSSEDEVWVEKASKKKDSEKSERIDKAPEREDWLANSDDLFATISRERLKPKQKEKNKPERISIDEMGQSSRELNPYWKDGGSGLPEEGPCKDDKSAGTVGDLGLSWLHKALARAKQTALDENKPIEEIVAPVWGSLDRLLTLIKEAEDKVSNRSKMAYGHSSSSKSAGNYEDRDHRRFHRPGRDDHRDRDERKSLSHSERDREKSRASFRKPADFEDDSYSQQKNPDYDRTKSFKKPSDGGYNEKLERLRNSYHNAPRSSWKKHSSEPSTSTSNSRDYSAKREQSPMPVSKEEVDINKSSSPNIPIEPDDEEKPEIITQDEMNKIAAEILKAEMFGNEDEVKELKVRLKKAQAWLSGGGKSRSGGQKEVLLTETDSRGFTRPIQISSSSRPESKKRTKIETHKDGKRVRYFGNDDSYSLQDLVHQEKFVSVSDQNEMYARLAKGVGQKAGDDDFEEGGGREKSEEWADFSRRERAAADSTKRERTLDSCKFCLDSSVANRKLIISLMDKVYLCVPPYQSLTDGHCLIMPIQHTPCATLLDEDVWEEIMDLRRLLVKMFLDDEKDVIFYESAKNLNKFPHMILNCVPVPKEVGDDAPIYFKKALLECETEWTNNKKVVDLKGRDVRKAVPKGLPYFSVDFGLQSGYAHVIEDERFFPRNFAEEVIGGMMDMDHLIWRKHKKDDQQVQIAKTQQFIKKFKEFTSKAH